MYTSHILIKSKNVDAFAVFLNDKPRNYKCKPYPIIFEGVLFLIDLKYMYI